MRRPCRPILIALAVLFCCGLPALAEDPRPRFAKAFQISHSLAPALLA